MLSKFQNVQRWQFSTSVLLPVVLIMIVAAAAMLGFIFWSTANIDARALERQTSMLDHVLGVQREQIRHDQESIAVWDEALVATKLSFNPSWIGTNLGNWVYEFFGHNRSVVLDAQNRPIYMMVDGKSVSVERYEIIADAIAPLVANIRAQIDDGGMTQFNQDNYPVPPTLSEFVVVDGAPAIVSVMPIVSNTHYYPQEPGTEPLLVGIFSLDAGTAQRLNDEYLFEGAHFSLSQNIEAGKALYPLINNAGRFVAFFSWSQDRPGKTLLGHTAPAFVLTFGIGAIMVSLLLVQLRRSSSALEAGRVHAEYQAAHDRLTGLLNRTSFDAELARILADPRPSAHLTLLMLDLDRFKQINDTLGHQAGDDLIRIVGERLRATVGDDMLIARLGGDEFAILAVSHDRALDGMVLSNRIIDAIGQPFELNHFMAFIGVSIGIVNATSGNGAEPRELVRKADIALYEAKSAGRNRAVVYEEKMNELLQLQHTIEAELRDALRREDQLSVVFQPLVDQQTRKVSGAEALARWHHPKFGQISPSRFIPVAENTGLIEMLGEFVLRRACELGANTPGRDIAVNISPTQLRNPKFAMLVFDILHQTGMRPTDLELEITESILLDDEHTSAQNLRILRASGIHIALDDFGTGYSSLSYLKRYPVDRIKIDRSFVSQLAPGHVSSAITQAIVTLAHAMDISVTAEGVETEDQADMLGQMGCNTLQGYLFSPAVAPEKIAAVFADPANAFDRRRATKVA